MAETSDQEQTVAGLGEEGVLKRILPRLRGADMLLGPGDDAAIIAAPGGRFVFTIDTLVQDQDFRLNWRNGYQSTGYDVGWKSAAQNLSDVNAMGAVATAAVISLTLPPHTPVSWVEGIADGFTDAVSALGAEHCALAGGDLSSGGELSITAALTGSVPTVPVLRSGARPGDVIAVCGNLGAAAAGLALLESDETYASLGGSERYLIEFQCRPRPPLWAGPTVALAGATAMLDISDGLGRDASRMAQASNVTIDLSSIMLHELRENMKSQGVDLCASGYVGKDALLDLMLAGGEDHGLVISFPPTSELPQGVWPVGSVLEQGSPTSSLSASASGVFLDSVPLAQALNSTKGSGFDHFS